MLSVNTKKTVALTTAAAVALGALGGAALFKNKENKVLAQELCEAEEIASSYHSMTSGKNETVYVITDGNGERITYVSSWLHNPDGSAELSDVSNLTDIEVVKGGASLEEDRDGSITWNTEGEDVYYRGVTTEELPVDVSVSYALDGNPISGEDLQGRSGHLEITVSYTNNMYETVSNDEGEEHTIYMPFVMTTGMLLDNSYYSNIEVSEGQAVNDGDRTYVIGIGFPGLYESLGLDTVEVDDPDLEAELQSIDMPEGFTVECDVVDCGELTALTVASVLDLDEIGTVDDTDGINEDMDAMSEGMSDILDGSEALYNGVSELNDGVATLDDGASELANGASALSEGAGVLASGASSLASGAEDLSTGANTLAGGAASLSNGTSQLVNGASSLSEGITQVNNGAVALNNGITQIQANVPALQSGVNELATGASSLSEGASALSAGVDTLYGQLTSEESQAQITALITGSAQFSESLSALNTAMSASMTPEQAEALQNAIAYLSSYSENIEDPEEAAVYAECLNALVSSYSTLAGQLGQVSSAVSALNDGYAGINAGINTLGGKFGEVAEAVASIRTGASSVAGGASSVSSGLTTLSGSTSTLVEGINSLAQGSSTLSNGTSQLVTGASALSSGIGQVNTGAAELASGAASLAEGAGTLASGADDLSNGADAVYEGASSLSSGADRLAEGTSELTGGVGELLEGAGALNDGLNDFNDQAVDKIIDVIGNLTPVSDRAEELRDYAATYTTYSGTPSGVEDSVVFVFKNN